MTDRPRLEDPGIDPEDPQQPTAGSTEEGPDRHVNTGLETPHVKPGPETPGDLWGRQHDGEERQEDDTTTS
jgi:hypothetical protein